MATFNNQFEPIVRMEVDSFEDFDHDFEQPDHDQTIHSATIKPPKRLSVADSEEDLLLQPKRRMIEESDNNLNPHQLAESVPTPLSPGKRASKSPGKRTAASGLQAAPASKPAPVISIAPQGLPYSFSFKLFLMMLCLLVQDGSLSCDFFLSTGHTEWTFLSAVPMSIS